MGEKVRSVIAYANDEDVIKAFHDVSQKIDIAADGRIPSLIVWSSCLDYFVIFSKKLNDKYKGACIIGCVTQIAFCNEGFGTNGVNLVAVFEGLNCYPGVIQDVKSYPSYYTNVIVEATDKLKDYENVVCLQFTTAFGNCEELVQDTYKSVLLSKGIPIFGGTAGGDHATDDSYVSLNGMIYNEASVFVLIKNLQGGIHIFRENIFRPCNHSYTATDVDCDERAVYEYNNRPAATVVAESLHVPVEMLQEKLRMHPVGRIEGDKIYIAETDRVRSDGSITYFSRIYNFTELIQLEPDDVHEIWEATGKEIINKAPKQEFSILVNCVVRKEYFEQRELLGDFQENLQKYLSNYIGVCGFGENVDFQHLNSTLIILCFD